MGQIFELFYSFHSNHISQCTALSRTPPFLRDAVYLFRLTKAAKSHWKVATAAVSRIRVHFWTLAWVRLSLDDPDGLVQSDRRPLSVGSADAF